MTNTRKHTRVLLAALVAVVISCWGTADVHAADAPSPSGLAAPAVAGSYFKVVNRSSGKCMDIRREDPALGAHVQQYDCTGTDNQLWTAVATGDGYYFLVSKQSGLCMAQFAGVLWMLNCNGVTSQQWSAVAAGFEWNELHHRSSGQCAYVTGTNNLSLVQLTPCSGSFSQHWQFVTV
ncbi:RICIN domain-containing protein [Streptomyces sp. NPDC050548]|uniref:RICIN domain-containing protein n=1 Tax=Streptomyces sp. NPDC050548 TaxID=3365629 RepID=UPI00378BA6A4